VAQESLARTLAARERISGESLEPYAVATARNLLTDVHRDTQLERRHRHRLLDLNEMPDPAARLLAEEQAAAVRAALDGLDKTDRDLLLSYQEGVSTGVLASEGGSTPSAVAMRLHRIRARMRLDYLLALRRVQLPTPRCRPVLLAISAKDHRRQRAIGADRHVASCATCTALVPPLVERSSRLAGIALAPLVGLGTLGGRGIRVMKTSAGQAGAAVTAAAVAATCYAVFASGQPHHAAAPAPAPVPSAAALLRTADGTRLLPVPGAASLHLLMGQRVIAAGVPVQSVVSHPGFWVGTSTGERLYVHISDPERVVHPVRRGQRLRFSGRLAANAPAITTTDGVTPAEGAGLLTAEGIHIEVSAAALAAG
jgi:RNA polymerase sigma factor (sigma-70 family)